MLLINLSHVMEYNLKTPNAHIVMSTTIIKCSVLVLLWKKPKPFRLIFFNDHDVRSPINKSFIMESDVM